MKFLLAAGRVGRKITQRRFGNADIGASFNGLMFNTHDRRHYLRAAQEGIVYALNYGIEITAEMGVSVEKVRAGDANMFLSPLFREIFATVTGATALKQARIMLARHKSIRANIVEKVQVGGHGLIATGRYLQRGPLKLRLEFDLQIGKTTGALLEVCDGEVLYTARPLVRTNSSPDVT